MSVNEDIDSAWARRQENIRGTLKLLRVIVAASQQHTQKIEARYQLGGAESWVLWELHRTPGMRVVDLAKAMALHATTVTQMTHQLALQGLLSERSDDPAGKRVRYCLSRAGEQLLASLPPPAQGPFNAALEQLDDSALTKLIEGLRQVVSFLPEADAHAALKPLAELLKPPSNPTLPH